MVQVRRDVDALLVAPNDRLRGQLKLIAFDQDFFVPQSGQHAHGNWNERIHLSAHE
jgi:hypothetical protein